MESFYIKNIKIQKVLFYVSLSIYFILLYFFNFSKAKIDEIYLKLSVLLIILSAILISYCFIINFIFLFYFLSNKKWSKMFWSIFKIFFYGFFLIITIYSFIFSLGAGTGIDGLPNK